MKKLLALMLVLSMMLCACGKPKDETPETTVSETQSTEEATEAPTEAPTQPAPIVYRNPLSGKVVDSPMDTRVVAVTINNIPPALPLCGINDADMFFEMYINDYATRGLALFADIRNAGKIGSVRSIRYNFTDIAQSYDAFIAHSGGSVEVLSDANKYIDHLNIGTGKTDTSSYSFRDSDRRHSGYALEHTLFANGKALYEHLLNKNVRMTRDPEKDFGMHFVEDGTPAGGEAASQITINLIHKGHSKKTIMTYDEKTGLYNFSQYKRDMIDGNTKEPIAFKNVFILMAQVNNKGVYHVADLDGSGNGYYACGGKLIPIKWHREDPNAPFTFTLTDGSPLQQGVGSSYFAIAPLESKISW